jgi:phage nucleotide-binding protein
MEIYKASDIETENGVYLIYAPPGTGKTSLLKYLPGKTLVLDVDRTTRVLKDSDDIDISKIDNVNTWKAWGESVKELSKMDLSSYQNIALDNISELERCLLADLGRQGNNNRVPGIQNYQQVQFFLMDSVRFLKTLGLNVIILAWETTDVWTTPEGQSFNRSYPQISLKIMQNMMGLCDVVGKLFYNEKTDKRGIFLQATDAIFAKNQIDVRKHCMQDELILKEGDADAAT